MHYPVRYAYRNQEVCKVEITTKTKIAHKSVSVGIILNVTFSLSMYTHVDKQNIKPIVVPHLRDAGNPPACNGK